MREVALEKEIVELEAEVERLKREQDAMRGAAKRMIQAIDGHTIPCPESDAYIALSAALRGER